MVDYNKYFIEDILLDIISRKVKSFYIEYFAKVLSSDISTALSYLDKFSKESDKIKVKYEIRCLKCFDIIREYENIEDIEIGSIIECETCGNEEDEITLELSNIYIKYYINEGWLNYVKQKQTYKDRSSGLNNSPNNTPTKKQSQENGSLSMESLKEMGMLEVALREGRIVNIYINNGNTGAMGEKSTTFGANFNEKENECVGELYQ